MLGGFTFMMLGDVLLIVAIRSVRLQWSELSPFGRFVGIVGLLLTNFMGGYIYHYFFSRHPGGEQARTLPVCSEDARSETHSTASL